MATAVSPQTAALAQQAANSWNDFVARFSPVQDSLHSMISDIEGQRQNAMATSMSKGMDTAQVGTPAISSLMAGLRQPDASAVVDDTINRANGYRKGLGAAEGALEPALLQRKMQGELSIDANGRGIQSGAQISLGDIQNRTAQAQMQSDALSQGIHNSIISSLFSGIGMYGGAKNLFAK